LPTTKEVFNESSYPTPEERRHFYLAYLSYPTSVSVAEPGLECEAMIETLERHVKAWSPASRAFSTVWAIVQGREQLEGKETAFDYTGHARRRMDEFFKELEVLGI
jgi:choline kinase